MNLSGLSFCVRCNQPHERCMCVGGFICGSLHKLLPGKVTYVPQLNCEDALRALWSECLAYGVAHEHPGMFQVLKKAATALDYEEHRRLERDKPWRWDNRTQSMVRP